MNAERLMFECPQCRRLKDAVDEATGTVFHYRMCWNQRAHEYIKDIRHVKGGSLRMRPVVVKVVQR